MQRGGGIFAGVVLVIGLVYCGLALGFPRGTLAQPGPGIYTLLVGALLVIAAAGTLAQAVLKLRTSADVPIEWATSDGRVRIAGILVAAFGYLLVVGPVGHLMAAFLACAVVMRTQGEVRWIRVGLWSVGLAVASYYGFVVLLGVHLPSGLLFG
jgi:putative tricarboxylic transport membrane protein